MLHRTYIDENTYSGDESNLSNGSESLLLNLKRSLLFLEYVFFAIGAITPKTEKQITSKAF